MRKRMKKFAAYLMAAVMMLSCVMVDGATVKAEGTTDSYIVNPADYDIEYLLSLYQVYLQGDLTTTNTGHQVGALIVGGSATLGNSFGNVTIAPSYINHIAVFGQTNDYYPEIENEYGDVLTDVIYYTSRADSVYLTTQPKSFSKVDSYIDFDVAYTAIKAESSSKASSAGTTIDTADVNSDGYIYLDVSTTTSPRTYKITEEAFKKAVGIRFTGTNGAADVFLNNDTTKNNPVEISVVGCDGTDEKVTLDFNGSGSTGTYSVGVEMENGSGGYVAMGSALKDKMTGAKDVQSGQVFAKGMNLMWNFPDATNIEARFLSGHMVAPNAYVAVEGGNYEGGIIAASAYLNSEGHFYPYYEIGTAVTTGNVEEIPVTKYVKKTWNDNNNKLNNRPDSVTVYLIKDGVKVENSEITLNAGNSWAGQWPNLEPKHEYSVGEETVPGYTYEVVEDGGTFEVINTPATTSITVTKVWANDGYNVNNTRKDVTAKLFFAGTASIPSEYLGNQSDTVTLNESNNWTYTWTDLPAYQNGAELSYMATETAYPEGYTPSSSQTGNNVILTNTYSTSVDTSGVDKTTFTVNKAWNTTGDSNPPTETQVYLVVDGTVDGTAVTLNAANNWSYTWTDLPKSKTVDGTSVDIVYSAKEIVVPDDYTVSYGEIADNAITITNTYTPVTSKTVKKIWNDGNSASRPTSINVQLYADGVAYGNAVTLPQNGSWEYTWTDLPELKTGSAEQVVYTVKEVNTPEGYECTTENVDDTITLINTLKATEETEDSKTGSITLTGTKKLAGDTAPSETYNFVVKEGSTQVATGSVTGAGAIIFTEIAYDEDDIGTHTYTITETAGDTTGMEYDDGEITVAVTVAEGTDALTATVTSGAGTIEFTNTYTEQTTTTPSTADATFSKKAVSADGDELAGAEIKLTYNSGSYDLSGVTYVSGGKEVTTASDSKSITWTSTDTAVKLSGLPEGEYTMTETAAPKGYKYATAISFKVDTDGEIYQKKADGTYETTATTTLTMVDEAKAGEITLLGLKNLAGDTAPSETYNFVVKEGSTQVATGSVNGAGAITFTKITYGPEDIGEHTYTITEIAGSTDGMSYDTTSKTVKVTVSDDGNDALKATVNTVGSDDIKFTNTYDDPTPSTADATFSKKAVSADGAELAGAKITLTYDNGDNDLSGVTAATGSGGTDVKTATDNKSITWTSTTTAVKLTGLPEGEYTMTETAAPKGYKYATAISFKVDADGKIYQKKADGTYETTATTTLTMVDEAKAGSITLTGTKVLAGDTAPSETYNFVVKEGTTQVATGSVTGAGAITFTKIEYGPEDIGDHTYTITETAGYTTGMDYDDSTKTVTVTVSDEGDDTLAAAVKSGSDTVSFTNTYTEPTGPLTAIGSFSKKAVSADGAELAGAKITLTYDNGDNDLSGVTAATGSGGDNITTAANNKSISWISTTTAVKLTGLPEGEYTMTETAAPEGYKYATAISFKVDADGKIYQKKADGTYETTATTTLTMVDEAKVGSIYLTGKKVLAGDAAPSETYSFVVKEETTQVATGSVTGEGNVTFTKIEYGPEDIGNHTYTITEIAGSTTGMQYDNTEITVVVTVSDNGNDTLDATITNGAGTITFTNTYTETTPEPETTTVTKTIKKVWADENDKDKLRPASIEVSVLADGVATGKTAILSTENNWTVKVENLPVNNSEGKAIVYSILEISVPTGYTATYSTSGDVLTVTNTDTSTTEDSGNKDASTGGLKITVLDEKTNDPVPGATVQVKYPDGTVETKTTDSNGEINYPQEPGIPTGDYEITVTDVPDGYTVTTGKTGKATVVEDKIAEHVAKVNTSTGGLKITVVDEKTNDPVPGATVQVKYPDGTVETKITDSNGEINYPQEPGIPTGDYEITVIDVPDGYTVTTGETGKVTVVEDNIAEHVAKIDISEDSTSKPDDDTDEDSTEDSDEDSDDDSDDDTDSDSSDDDTGSKSDDKDNDTDSDSTVRTGDDSPVKPVVAVMLIALALLAVLFFIRKRNSIY